MSSRFENIDELTLEKAIKIEKRLGSIDKTPKHKISIGKGIYPNQNGYDLETPQTYLRTENNKFEIETEYFYTPSDSSVKVILYEWRELKKDSWGPQDQKKKDLEKFSQKFNNLKDELTSKLGKPSFIEKSSDTAEANFRDGIKWLSGENNKAYLFMLGSNNTGYRNIRLAIYRE